MQDENSTLTQIQREDIYNNWTIYSMTGKAAQGRCTVHFFFN